MLGIFTVVITFEQQKVARLQRVEDKSESRLQREQDWNISQTAIAAQNKASTDRYRDEVLLAYIKEIGDLLKENKGSLTNDSLTATVARIKTLNTIRQLDGARQAHVIRFLYEAKQLSHTDELVALDISTAELTDTDFEKLEWMLEYGQISLAGVLLKNCTLSDITLNNVNFTSARLLNINFSSALLDNIKFSNATLHKVSFSNAALHDVIFSYAIHDNVNFSFTRFYMVNFSSANFGYNG